MCKTSARQKSLNFGALYSPWSYTYLNIRKQASRATTITKCPVSQEEADHRKGILLRPHEPEKRVPPRKKHYITWPPPPEEDIMHQPQYVSTLPHILPFSPPFSQKNQSRRGGGEKGEIALGGCQMSAPPPFLFCLDDIYSGRARHGKRRGGPYVSQSAFFSLFRWPPRWEIECVKIREKWGEGLASMSDHKKLCWTRCPLSFHLKETKC